MSKNKKPSQSAVVTLYERVDYGKLSFLLSAKGIDEGLQIQLRKYCGKLDDENGCVEVKYFFSNNLQDKGRLYADKSLSLQNFLKKRSDIT